MPGIHPTATVDGSARVAEDVEIGPYCVVEADVEIGAGCVLRDHAVVRRYTTLGERNHVDSFVVLGGEPQDFKFSPSAVSYLRIGDDNTFRESVTISRGSVAEGATVVGNRTYWMANSHAGHDATVHDEAILVNGGLLAGHTVLGRRAILSGNAAVHQFCWVGEGVMVQGGSRITMHCPPFTMVQGLNNVAGLNAVGLRRSREIDETGRRQVKEAFRLLYRDGLTPRAALEEMDRKGELAAHAERFREFVRKVLEAHRPYNRGLCPMRDK